MSFRRFHQFRRNAEVRAKKTETFLQPTDFVLPLFLGENLKKPQPIASLPGVSRHSLASVIPKVEAALQTGVQKFLLFGIPKTKTDDGANAFDPIGVVPTAVRVLKKEFGRTAEIFTDVCLCSYLRSGHCGLLNSNGTLQNDATLKIIRKIAVVHAAAGADWVAPSGMLDGVVAEIGEVFKKTAGETAPSHSRILGYSAKFASSFYGPFRQAADCAPQKGDRQTYQLSPANAREALLEIKADLEEGADGVMVKPAGPYLDVISRARQLTKKPLFAYQVSGEYASLVAAIQKGWLDQKVIRESLLGIKRAGADFVISYFADRLKEVI